MYIFVFPSHTCLTITVTMSYYNIPYTLKTSYGNLNVYVAAKHLYIKVKKIDLKKE